MPRTALSTEADYDLVGKYHQDEINGFERSLIERMLELVEPADVTTILDAMAGDGNLTAALLHFCRTHRIAAPRVTVLDFSKVQVDLARASLPPGLVECMWGDMLTLQARDGSAELVPESFDRVMIKSANHELPLEQQGQLYTNIFKLLREGGRFVNLGFVFDDEAEREEFRRLTRVKDTLAGLRNMARNRHFLTRDEFDDALRAAGFTRVVHREPIVYRLHSQVVAQHYFPAQKRERYETLLQVAQIKARRMRRAGRIMFDSESSLMLGPGEITVVEKVSALNRMLDTYREYPYDFVRHIAVHRELLERVARRIPSEASVLDLGSGLGLLRERLGSRSGAYLGVEANPEFVSACRERFATMPRTTFVEQNLNDLEIITAGHDVVCLLNVIYQPGINVEKVLAIARAALKPGGILFVSGPSSANSFREAEDKIRQQLVRDRLLPQYEQEFRAICIANRALLAQDGNYFSRDGIIEALRNAGFPEILESWDDIFYHTGYLAVARKN